MLAVGKLLILLLLLVLPAAGQELYPLNEPASTMPKGVLGVRISTESFKEVSRARRLHAVRFMYGITPRLTLLTNLSMSNHHDRKLPEDLINHSHGTNGQTNYYTQNIKRGAKYPYLFNGVHVLAKYRFLSIDKKNEHFRMALVGEWSSVNIAHDEAEPTLTDDTGGYGVGFIATYLMKRFAASFTYGFIKPNSYYEREADPGKPDLPTKINYGDGQKFNVSLGYLFYPKHYTGYDNPNWNVYIEFMGKKYDKASVIQNGINISTNEAIALTDGYYWEVHPGIQRIVNSNLRMDLTIGFSFISQSYVRFTPVWMFGVQRYFYRK